MRPFALAAILASGLTATAAHASTVVFTEDFSGFPATPSGTQVLSDIPFFTTANSQFTGGAHLSFSNTGGPATYSTGPIDITGFTSLNLSFDFFGLGNWDQNSNGVDSIAASVSTDGGSTFTSLLELLGNDASPNNTSDPSQDLTLTSFSTGVGDGTSLVFNFTVDSDGYEIAGLDNILITGEPTQASGTLSDAPSPVPVPASVLFLMGGIGALGAMRARRKKTDG